MVRRKTEAGDGIRRRMTEAVNFAAALRINQGDRLWTQPNREDDGSRIPPMILIITELQNIGALLPR
jgi:hypothetical protein